MFWLQHSQSPLSTHKMEGKIKILEIIHKLEEIVHVYLIFCAFGYFYCDVGNDHVWLG